MFHRIFWQTVRIRRPRCGLNFDGYAAQMLDIRIAAHTLAA